MNPNVARAPLNQKFRGTATGAPRRPPPLLRLPPPPPQRPVSLPAHALTPLQKHCLFIILDGDGLFCIIVRGEVLFCTIVDGDALLILYFRRATCARRDDGTPRPSSRNPPRRAYLHHSSCLHRHAIHKPSRPFIHPSILAYRKCSPARRQRVDAPRTHATHTHASLSLSLSTMVVGTGDPDPTSPARMQRTDTRRSR